MRVQIQPALLQHLQILAGQQLSDVGQLLLNLIVPHVQASTEGHSNQALVLELKPKWGLMPEARWIQPAHAVKLQHSRFELMQKLKAAKAVRHSCLPLLKNHLHSSGPAMIALGVLLARRYSRPFISHNTLSALADASRL